MKNQERVENFSMEDGRRAERRVWRNEEGHRVVEVYAEDKKPLILQKRVIEKEKPVVCERRVETIVNGEVTEVRFESSEPKVSMELREHIATVGEPQPNYVTRDDIKTIVSMIAESVNPKKPQIVQSNVSKGSVVALSVIGISAVLIVLFRFVL